MTIKTIKSIFIAVLLSIILSTNLCNAQEDKTKAFLFLSVFCEEANSYFEQSADFIKEFHTWYDNFSYEYTNPAEIPVDTIWHDSLQSYEKYTIQLFKIKKSSHSPIYYILKISSCDTYRFSFPETLWIRLSGYRESDIKVFLDALRKQGLKKREIIEMVNQWCISDEMFREIDWDCLLKGYYKNNTHSDCFVSGANIRYKMRYWGQESDIYAIFSKKPLAGTLFEFD